MSKANLPTKTPTSHELAWAAGIVDGEGCILVAISSGRTRVDGSPGGRTHELRLVIINTNEPMLRRFREWFGGHILKRTRKFVARRQTAEWRIVGNRAADCLRLLLPYLCVKLPEAELGIQMAETLMGRKGRNVKRDGVPPELYAKREKIREELQRLKRIEYTFSDFEREALQKC